MKSIIFILLTLSLICLMSCSSQKPQNTETTNQGPQQTADPSSAVNLSEPGNQAQPISSTSSGTRSTTTSAPEPQALSFPVTDDLRQLKILQQLAYVELTQAITSYRRSEGSNPKTLGDLINSGLLLFWPRNISSGKPVSIFNGKTLPEEFSGFGILQYSRNNDGFAQMNYIIPNTGRKKDLELKTWDTQLATFPAKEVNDLPLVEGINVPIHKVDDPFARKVLANLGQITSLIVTKTIKFYESSETMPSSFDDLLSPQQLVIRENFDQFVKLMKSPDIEFKWGNDIAKNSFYLYLKIKGKVYMEQCYYLGDGVDASTLQKMKSCSFSELDTSSPILSSENIDQLVIPDDYFVSIKDIPVSE